MKKPEQFKASIRTYFAIVIAIIVIDGIASTLCPADAQTNAALTQAASPDANAAPQGITGAELYSIHCNRCHPERYPTERTAANWKTINLHMQVRANIPPAQARLILKYLQDNSGR